VSAIPESKTMLDKDQIAAASQTLHDHWRAGTKLGGLEPRLRPRLRDKRFTGHGKNVLGDPRIALTWLVNELRQLGVTLRAGQVVTTGTCHAPLPIQSGDVFGADFGAIGRVSVRFE
jgi:2-keto-4-pentenoate hydratase